MDLILEVKKLEKRDTKGNVGCGVDTGGCLSTTGLDIACC